MVVNQKPTGLASSIPGALCIGGVVSTLATVLIAALLAKLVDAEIIAESKIGYGVMTLLLASAIVGSTTACRKAKRRFLLVSALSGVTYLCILLSITALFFGGQYSAVGVTALLVFGGSLLPVFLRKEWKNGAQATKRKRKIRYSAQKKTTGK